MSFNVNSRKVQRGAMTAALARIEEEGGDIIRRLARQTPAKELARVGDMTPRHAYNLQDGQCQPRWVTFIALAREYPELRSAVARWVGLEPSQQVAALRADLIAEIERRLQTAPEAGNVANE